MESESEFHYIYFNLIYDVSKEIKISFYEEYKGIDNLEIFDGKNPFESSHNNNLSIKICRFKLYPDIFRDKNNENIIKINLEQNNNKNVIIFNLDEDNIDITRDYYEYNIKIENANTDIIKTTYDHQFEIYDDFIMNKLHKTQNSKENEEFINSSLRLITDLKSKYTLNFYMLIFQKCLKNKILQKHIPSFFPEKISDFGNFSEKNKNSIIILIYNWFKKPDEIIIDDENLKNKIYEELYFVIIYFNYFCYKDNSKTVLDNEKIFLTENHVSKLIQISKNFDQILTTINYVGSDFKSIILVININFENILKIIKESKKNSDNTDKNYIIEIDKYVKPNKEDNLKEIFYLIDQIINFEIINQEIIIMKFTPEFFIPYINFNTNNNVINLIFLKEIIIDIKKIQKDFVFEQNINNLIHQTGLKVIEEKKLNNSEIFLFLQKNEFYNDKKYEKNNNLRSIKVFDGIDIQNLNLSEWKKFDFKKMFKNQLEDFTKKIISLVSDMKNFGLLFELLKIDELEKIPNIYSTLLKKRYYELLKGCYLQNCPTFIEDTKKLLYIMDKNKENMKKNMDVLTSILDIQTMNKILIKLSECEDISKDLKNIIKEIFKKGKSSNPYIIIFLIKNSKTARTEIFQNMDKYLLSEQNIFRANESDNFIILKGLIDSNYLVQNSEKIGNNYEKETLKLLNTLQNKLKNNEINYNTLIPFFNGNQESKKKLADILHYIFFKDEKESKNVFDKIQKKIKEIHILKEKFETILKYLIMYFPNTTAEDIDNIYNIIKELTNNKLNQLESVLNSKFQKYEKYYEDAVKIDKNLQSMFFVQLSVKSKNNTKNDTSDELFILNDIKNDFNEVKKLFESKDGISKIKPEILDICISAVKEMPNKLKNEIQILLEIFNIKQFLYTDKLYVELLLLSQKEKIYDIASAIYIFLSSLNCKGNQFLYDMKNIRNKLRDKTEINVIKNSKNKLKEYGIDIDNINDEKYKYIDILLKLNQNPDCTKLLLNSTLEDCIKLKELSLEEEDDNVVSINDILDMEKCIEFLLSFGKVQEKSDIEIINLLKEKVSQQNNIILYFDKFLENFGHKKILQSLLNKSGQIKYQIDRLFKGGVFEINNLNDKQVSFACTYGMTDKKTGIYKMKQLFEEDIKILRDKALLSKNITKSLKYFISLVNEISDIHIILRKICKKGYPKLLRIQVLLKSIKNNEDEKDGEFIYDSKYFIDSNEKKSLEEIKEELNVILDDLNKYQITAYKTQPLIRFFYGRKFNLIYEHFNSSKIKERNINSFFKYITNDKYHNKVTNFIPEKGGNIIKDTINNIEKYLSELLKINNLTLEKIYKESIIKSCFNRKYKGLYMYKCQKLEIYLFQIYKYLTGNEPPAQNILLCNKETDKEEIMSFIYRAVNCEYNSCFIISDAEYLEYEQANFLINLFDNFFQNEEQINSCIIFLYSNSNVEICENMELKKYKDILQINEEYQSFRYDKNNIEIIYSDKSGAGKSTQIKKEIEDNGKKWIYFPFGGVLKRDEIINRLMELNMDNNCVVHLDLYNTDDVSLMIEFLFSFLILRYFGKDENIFYLSKNIEIKIEIPNTFINFFEKFQILNLFSKRELTIIKLLPLIVDKDLNSNIQIVSNYLKCLKENKISDIDLIFPGITPQNLIEDSRKKIVYKKANKKIITALDAEILTQKECEELINEYIKIDQPTYYQITSFINFLSIQFKKFNQNYFLNAHNLKLTAKHISIFRQYIIENFIKITKYFTEGAFTNLIKKQDNIFKENEEAMNQLVEDKHYVVSFNTINTTLIFFHEGINESFSVITNKNENDEEYQNFLTLKNCQEYNEAQKLKCLPKYDDENYSKKDFLIELKSILDVRNPATIEDKNKDKSELISLEEITQNYVITADNFVKMVLILLRIRSNIPVIMMGETGCGKTSLIRKLSEMKNNGDSNKMKIMNIHAGTNDSDIIHFIKNSVIPDALNIENENINQREIYKKMGLLFEDKKLWVFLDEINTCKSMGLISELMCKHTYQGKELPKNIVFIAACNPYRKKDKKAKEEKIGLDANKANKEKKYLNEKEKQDLQKYNDFDLAYKVNPLPHSLLNFVFDFGSLREVDEDKYIKCIIEEVIKKIYFKNKKFEEKDEEFLKLKKLAQDMVINAHKFIKINNDRATVSLREIRRFNIFYEFFYDYFQKRKKNYEDEKDKHIKNEEDEQFFKSLDHYTSQIYSINLSVYICYYLRITNKESREKFVTEMNKIFIKNDFLKIPKREENFIINNIKIEKGIAKNRALLENIFSLFVALNSKVPIFIVGKPGCSKSLSFQLINKSMQAMGSESSFFKNYPKLLVIIYQGSMASNSKAVENIFKKARDNYKILSSKDKLTNISTIFFDEIGLAEHSPNNPLKVIHSKLEYDENEGENKIAFLGISNWDLDAAKMNRGIFISIPDLNEDEIKETSLTIGESYDESLAQKYSQLYKDLGSAYYKYKNILKTNYNSDGKEDFHGNRDFYHLIKHFSRNILEYEKNNNLNKYTLIENVINSIERNFGGINLEQGCNSIQKFKELLKEKYPKIMLSKKYDAIERAKENIYDINSRYLLIIAKSSVSAFLISNLVLSDKEHSFYVGSKFKNDLNKEEYSTKIINKIQADMENGNLIILKDLETINTQMYDLFNQNFTAIGGKNYVRLSIGSSNNNIYSLINDNFRCIVTVDIDKIDEEEAPFLNRFEKHILSFEEILSKGLSSFAKEIYQKLLDLINISDDFISINYSLKNLLINCELEEIQYLIFKSSLEDFQTKDEICDYILSKISLTFPQDVILSMKYGKFWRKYYNLAEKIIKYYKQGVHTNLAEFINKIPDKKNVVYTFSNKMGKIKNLDEKKIKKIIIGMIKYDSELEKLIDDFYINDDNEICLIQITPEEGKYFDYIKCLIENKEKNYVNKNNKIFVFIVHLFRISNDEMNNFENINNKKNQEIGNKILKENLSNSAGYYQIFIDNLNGEENLKIENIFNDDSDIIFNSFFDVKSELLPTLLKAISFMKYNINNPCIGLENEDDYISLLLDYLQKKENEKLRELINKCLFKELKKENDFDIIANIFIDKNTIVTKDITDICFLIKQKLLEIYKSFMYILYFKLEKNQFFSSLLYNDVMKNSEKDILEKIYESYLNTFEFNDGATKIFEAEKKNKINIILGFKCPGIQPILDKIIKEIRENIRELYINNENNLRRLLKDEKTEINEYYNKLNIFTTSTNNIINEEKYLIKIINDCKNDKDSSEELFNLIKKDYLYYFIKKNLNEKKRDSNEACRDKEIVYDMEEVIKFIELIYKTRVNSIKRYFKISEDEDEIDIISNLSNLFNYIESYSGSITKIIHIFIKLSQKMKNLYNEIEEIISKKEIIFEISNKYQEYNSVVNESFFISIDSILRVIITNEKIYAIEESNSDIIIFNLITTYKEILQIALSLNNELTCGSKEAVSLKEIMKLFDVFVNIGMLNIENFKYIMKYFKDETKYINEKNSKKLCENFEIFYEFLMKFEKNQNKNFDFYKTLSFIFLNEYLKINDNDFRELLFKKILPKNEMIKNSSQLIKILVENVIHINVNEMKNNLKNILDGNYPLWKKINNEKKIFLDEVIMNIFEEKIVSFFDSIPNIESSMLQTFYRQYYEDNSEENKIYKNKASIIFDYSFDIFKETCKFLEDYKNKDNNDKNQNIHLAKLYSVVYVKYYLYNLVKIIKEQKSEIKNKKKIIEIFNFIKSLSDDFSRVLKIYIFKLFYNFMNSNFNEFKNYDFKENFIDFLEEFDLGTENNFLAYFFLPLNDDDYNNYIKEVNLFDLYQSNNFKSETKELANMIKNYGLDIFISISINKIISNIGIQNYLINKSEYFNFSSFIKALFEHDFKISNNLKKLLYTLYDNNIFQSKVRKYLEQENGVINPKIFEIILYGFRFSVNVLGNEDNENNDKNYLYKSLLTKNYSLAIKSSYIPGIDVTEDYHLIFLESVEIHIKNFAGNFGCYVCSCGYYYCIEPCGFPDSRMKLQCKICGKPIGYPSEEDPIVNKERDHGMVKREGHYRIFKDNHDKQKQMKAYNDTDEIIPNKIYQDYLKDVIEPIRNKSSFGFNNISRDFFEKRDKKTRNLTNIGYRLLNYIAYSFLFFGYCAGNIPEKDLKRYLIKDLTILKIIEINWNILTEELKKKNINSTQIFMNMIFKKLCVLLKECKYLKKPEERELFENNVEILISECIKDYQSYKEKYEEENRNQLKINNYSFKYILNELVELKEEIYPHKQYPYFKYFKLTKYKTEE